MVGHAELRRGPVFGVLFCAFQRGAEVSEVLARRSALNGLDGVPAVDLGRYHKIRHAGDATEQRFGDRFLDELAKLQRENMLDLEAAGDPLHGNQRGC